MLLNFSIVKHEIVILATSWFLTQYFRNKSPTRPEKHFKCWSPPLY